MAVFTSVDFDRQGKQHGFLQVPYSHNLGGWANVMVPVTVIGNGAGRTALLLGGNHGDEYQGQIALMKLARSIEPHQVSGRLIIIPSLNLPAAKAATRLSPLDGMNMNRAFPGNPEGPVTSAIAAFLTHVLFPMADIVVDIHSGGRSLEFYPCSHMHLVPDKAQRRQMFEAMLAWNTDFCFLYTDIAGSGLLPVEAETQGKIVVTTEMGGGEAIPEHVHRLTQEGLQNLLVHLGLLQGKKQTREHLGKPPSRLVQALHRDNYLLAPESGIFEVLVGLGDLISAGQPVGQIHFLENPERMPVPILAKNEGYALCMRSPCLTQQGDCVMVVAQEVDPRNLDL